MKHINEFIKAFWAVAKWIILVLVATGISTAVILLGLLVANAIMAQVAPQFSGVMHTWSVILGTVVPLLVFIYVAYLAAHRALGDLERATENINSSKE